MQTHRKQVSIVTEEEMTEFKGLTHRKPLKSNLSRNAWLPNASLQGNKGES